MLGADGAADEHGDTGEGFEFLGRQEFADRFVDGPVENVTMRPLFLAVFGEQEDTVAKGRFPQTRVCENEAAL